MLAETEDMDERKQYMDIVEENNELLLQLISDILDLSKIEAGTFGFSISEMDVNLLCEDLVRSMQGKVPEGVELIFDNICRSVLLCVIVTGYIRLFLTL